MKAMQPTRRRVKSKLRRRTRDPDDFSDFDTK